jgi:hypothetical protein
MLCALLTTESALATQHAVCSAQQRQLDAEHEALVLEKALSSVKGVCETELAVLL